MIRREMRSWGGKERLVHSDGQNETDTRDALPLPSILDESPGENLKIAMTAI